MIGSSVWLRWIDFGLGIQKDGNAYELVQWASRDERDWPTVLRQASRPSEWPWADGGLGQQPLVPDEPPDEGPF